MNNKEISNLSHVEWVKYKKENRAALLNDYPNFNFDLRFELIKQFKNILENEDITLFLANGALLGAVREKDFIPWDDDVDMDVLIEEFLPKYHSIKQQLIELGYIVRGIERHPEMKINVYHGGEKVGICALYLEGEWRTRGPFKWPKYLYEDIEKINFRGEEFLAPRINDYLSHQYGSDWKTPRKTNFFSKEVYR